VSVAVDVELDGADGGEDVVSVARREPAMQPPQILPVARQRPDVAVERSSCPEHTPATVRKQAVFVHVAGRDLFGIWREMTLEVDLVDVGVAEGCRC
jgi:hypothetical protein